jgi:hypothetical protein
MLPPLFILKVLYRFHFLPMQDRVMKHIDGFIEVHIRDGKHMPKMTSFGLCDPFLSIAFGGRKTRTEVKKRTYSPEWNEKVVFSVPLHPSSLIIDLFHLSWSSRFERIGTQVISWEQLLAAITLTGEPRLLTSLFFNREMAVIGSDGCPTEVYLQKILYFRMPWFKQLSTVLVSKALAPYTDISPPQARPLRPFHRRLLSRFAPSVA